MFYKYKNSEGFSYIGKKRAWHISFTPFYIRTYNREVGY